MIIAHHQVGLNQLIHQILCLILTKNMILPGFRGIRHSNRHSHLVLIGRSSHVGKTPLRLKVKVYNSGHG